MFRQVQFIQEDLLVYIVSVRALEPGPEFVDPGLGGCGGDLGVSAVREQGGDAVVYIIIAVERNLRKGGGLGGAVPLTHQNRDLFDVVVALEGKDGKPGGLGIVPDNGGDAHVALRAVGKGSVIGGEPGHVAVLIPGSDGIPLEGLGEALVETGNIDKVIHALFLVELKGDAAALPPDPGGPMGLKVPVVGPLGVKFAAVLPGDVVLVLQLGADDGAVGDPV